MTDSGDENMEIMNRHGEFGWRVVYVGRTECLFERVVPEIREMDLGYETLYMGRPLSDYTNSEYARMILANR